MTIKRWRKIIQKLWIGCSLTSIGGEPLPEKRNGFMPKKRQDTNFFIGERCFLAKKIPE
jgi:hypothetical protein